MAKTRSMFDAPGFAFEDGTLSIKHGGSIGITEDANGNWSFTQGANTYMLTAAEVASIETINVGKATSLDLSRLAADDEDFTVKGAGSVNISGVTIAEATPTSQLSADAEIAGIDFDNTGGHTVNGSYGDYFVTVWDELDDTYGFLAGVPDGANVLNGAGANGYNNATVLTQPVLGETTLGPAALAVNMAFIDLGVEYIEYLQDGGAALVETTAKANGSGRNQSVHDNLLHNLNEVEIDFRNLPDLFTAQQIDDYIPADFEERPAYNGNPGDVADLLPSVQFDFDHGINRSDYADYGLLV